MAKHKHREQSKIANDTSTENNNRSVPFGIDPMQLMGLLGGNLDMNNIGNMLASMNTNGFNLGNLGSIAQMMGLNLDNNFSQGNMNNLNNMNNDINKNMHAGFNQNMKAYSSNTSTKSTETSNVDKNSRKSTNAKTVRDNDANLEFLISLRNFVHPDRIKFIDRIIEAYKNGELQEV
jgi:hypothetical protein